MSKIYGVGTNDIGHTARNSAAYKRWWGILARCYTKNKKPKDAGYEDCTVCEEWLTFSNFKAWMETQDWEGKELDKDILGDGKLYSPETCCFITPKQNNFFKREYKSLGGYPSGVDYHKSTNSFRSRVNNPNTGKREELGYFDNTEDAHKAWCNRKREIGLELFKSSPENILQAIRDRYK